MKLPSSLLAAAEVAVNAALRADPTVAARLRPFASRRLRVEVRALDLAADAIVSGQSVVIEPAGEAEPDAWVSGGPADLLHALMTDELAGRIEFRGDPVFAQDLLAVLRDLDLDPEEWLARRIGDVPGRRVAQFVRGAGRWLAQGARTLELDTAEYLREETRDLVHREEIAEWSRAVDRLRNDVERAAARLRAVRAQTMREESA